MNKKCLYEIIENDKKIYLTNNKIKKLYYIVTNHNNYTFYKAIKYSRLYRFYLENRKSLIDKLKFIYFSRKNNIYGRKNNIELYGKFDNNLILYHSGIVINKNACLGNNIKLHGQNCIGSKGNEKKAPIIGDNVDIGFGAIIIGDIKIAKNVIIGANSVVNKDILEEGCIVVGVPAKKIDGGKNGTKN